jgi:chemotaxis protein methyltransferase CheR
MAWAQLVDLVHRRAGALLSPDAQSLTLRKLEPVARLFGFRSADDLLAGLDHPPEELAQALVEAVMTSDTSFFRNPELFAFFDACVLPTLLAMRAGRKRLRIWCAGVSTGQEAYSIAMLLDQARVAASGWALDVIATDLSPESIARAREGIYSDFEVARGLSEALRATYFTREHGSYRIADRLRRMITFRTFNLLDDFGWLGELDAIFCRNVLMYLAPQARTQAIAKLVLALAPDAYLFIGGGDAGSEASVPLAPVRGVRGVFVNTSGAQPRLALRAAFGQ